MWNDEESEGDIDSKNEEDFLDKIVEEEKLGVNPRKYRNKGWYVALMRKNQLILCHLLLQYWGWAKYWYRQVDKNTFQQAKDHLRGPLFMSSRSDMAIHPPLVVVDVSLLHGTDQQCCSMGSTEAEGALQCFENCNDAFGCSP